MTQVDIIYNFLTLYNTRPSELADHILWVPLEPTAVSIVTRHYFELTPSVQLQPEVAARVQQGLALSIVPTTVFAPNSTLTQTQESGVVKQAASRDDREVATRLDRFTDFFIAHSLGMPVPDPISSPKWFSLRPNVIGRPEKWSKDSAGMGAVDIAYAAGPFLLKPHEVLLIEGTLPDCTFASVVLWNRFLQSFDYRHNPVSLHRGQMQLRDSRYRIAVGAANPQLSGVDWISTEGRTRGTLFWRFVLPTEEIATPRCTVMNISALADYISQNLVIFKFS
jgi:hypothetical protein